jgi:hypothetical protein
LTPDYVVAIDNLGESFDATSAARDVAWSIKSVIRGWPRQAFSQKIDRLGM